MSNKNNNIKSELLSLYKNGKSESEAHEEISKTHTSYKITLSVVNKWFEIFKSKVSTLNEYNATSSKKKFTDEYLISLVKDNPKLNMGELGRLAGAPKVTISRRLRQINTGDVSANYCEKSTQKFTDEYLIDLINENPGLNMAELSRITGTSAGTVSNRIKQVNRNGERVKYINKPFKPDRVGTWTANPKLGDEYLINLINNNPDLNMDELATLTDSSRSAISYRIKQINRFGLRANYKRKNGKKFTDEFLINLVNDNPDLNTDELAALADSSQPTIKSRILEANRHGLRVNYKKKDIKKFTDEFLIGLIDENPEFNKEELAMATNTNITTISRRINKISSRGESTNYVRKCHMHKFTDEFLVDLVNQNPDLNMTGLAKLVGVSSSTISRRIKEINSKGVKVNYTNKTTQKDIIESFEKPRVYLTDEYLINLINENPDLNMTELAKIAGTSQHTISSRIKKINHDGERVKYIKKRSNGKSKIDDKSK